MPTHALRFVFAIINTEILIGGINMSKYNVIFFTGAGISVESGLPTFQDQPGIRDKLHRDFANEFPETYRKTIREMVYACENAEPNAAHKAIAEAGFPVITMNVDRLHTRAGSQNVVEVHGVLPTREQLEDKYFPQEYRGIVLYGDIAPEYSTAFNMVKKLKYGASYFVIVGTSFYTGISADLKRLAEQRKAKILLINSDAATRVPELCEQLKKTLNGEKVVLDSDRIEHSNLGCRQCGGWDWE
jgi:NAD-dependent deacetylase